MCVLTTATPAGPAGTTVSAVCSLSLDPLLTLACLQTGSSALAAIIESGQFAINILSSESCETSARFAWRIPPHEKFDGVDYHMQNQQPVLDEAVAWITCTVHDALPGGDHTILVGAVTDMGHHDGEPLVFHRGSYRCLA